MTTPRIEEMVEELAERFCWNELIMRMDGSHWTETELREETRQALTQAHQAGIDEAVEIIKDIGMCNHAIYDGIKVHGKKCNPYTEALDDTIKALQDNK